MKWRRGWLPQSVSLLTITWLAIVLSGCARPLVQPGTPSELQSVLNIAREREQNDGFEAALPAYLEALHLASLEDKDTLLRYQLAMSWSEQGRDAEALDILAPVVRDQPDHPLVGPLYQQLTGNESAFTTTAVTGVTSVTEAASSHKPAQPQKSAWQVQLERLLHDQRPVRVLLPKDAKTWSAHLPDGAYSRGRQVVSPGWSGDLGRLQAQGHDQLVAADGGMLPVKLRSWTGHAKLLRVDGQWIVHLALDDYLTGVVGTEMSPSWHIQALKAQAVASRTYLVFALLTQNNKRAYDLRGDVLDQAFKPVGGQFSVVQAVKQTHSQILAWEGRPARVFFHADNGGISEDPKFVWRFDLPYYSIRNDPFSDRVDPWRAAISVAEVQRRLQLPAPSRITVQRDPSRRVTRLLWRDQRGMTHTVGGNDFRLAVGPRRVRSLLFDVDLERGRLVFSGRGYGHGVGMSQWGARTMAERGIPYDEILSYYYPGTELRSYDSKSNVAELLP